MAPAGDVRSDFQLSHNRLCKHGRSELGDSGKKDTGNFADGNSVEAIVGVILVADVGSQSGITPNQ
jgi:hypothetical protein